MRVSDFVEQIYKKEDASLRKTVFLDRDGTLVKEVHYLSDPSQLELLPGVIEGIKRLNSFNAILIIITNQPVIARGLATIKDVKMINNTLIKMLNNNNAYINAVYFCPHHPETNHSDIPPSAIKYRIKCECRKPKVEMLKKAVEDYNIDLEKAFIVGDSTRDIKAGEKLGIKTVLVQTGNKGRDKIYPVKPDYVAVDFRQAVDIICKR